MTQQTLTGFCKKLRKRGYMMQHSHCWQSVIQSSRKVGQSTNLEGGGLNKKFKLWVFTNVGSLVGFSHFPVCYLHGFKKGC